MANHDPRAQHKLSLWRRLARRAFRPEMVIAFLLISLIGLPFVTMHALAQATLSQMTQQASEISSLATSIRTYYADNVIGRLQKADRKAVFTENYRNVHGGIPIPATLSIEMGAMFDNAHTDGRISYRFISDYPFLNRKSPPLDQFELDALAALRADPEKSDFSRVETTGLARRQLSYRLATPVTMRQACVACHNAHPDSPKRDWKVGDIRGIQSITVRSMDVEWLSDFNNVLIYSAIVGLASIGSAITFHSQSSQLKKINNRLQDSNQRETLLTDRLSSQLSELSLLGSVVDKATFGISIADMRQKDAPLIYVNEAFVKITGYPKEKASGYNCRFLRGPETDPEVTKSISRAIRLGESITCELVNYRVNGVKFWNRLTLYPIFGSDGKPDFYVGNQVDITAAKDDQHFLVKAYSDFKKEAELSLKSINEALEFSRCLEEKLSAREILKEDQKEFFSSERESLAFLAMHINMMLSRLPDGE